VSEPTPTPGSTARRSRARRWLTLVAPLVLVAVAAVVVVVAVSGHPRAGQEYRVEVPAGTGARIDHGESVELIPADLHLGVNDTLVVANLDDRAHVVGPFSVRAGETVSHTFSKAGVYQGQCTIHPGGAITITVA